MVLTSARQVIGEKRLTSNYRRYRPIRFDRDQDISLENERKDDVHPSTIILAPCTTSSYKGSTTNTGRWTLPLTDASGERNISDQVTSLSSSSLEAQWSQLATKQLKKVPLESLNWVTHEDIQIKPLYKIGRAHV